MAQSFRLGDAWLGSGFWKLGYLTNDLGAAIDYWKSQMGVEAFDRFAPSFDIVMANGRSGTVRTECAFSLGRPVVVELIQPVDDFSGVWTDPLQGAREFKTVLHHIGVQVDDIQAAKRAAAAKGLSPLLESSPGADLPFVFYAPAHTGFYIEHMQMAPQADFISDLKSRPLPPA